MRTSMFVPALLSATLVAACSSPESSSPDDDDATDRVVVDAAPTTRDSIGIEAWGIADRASSIVVRGYDHSNAPVIAFEYRANRAAKATFEATLSGKGSATIRVKASETRVEVLEDSFARSAAAKVVLARMIEDLRTQPMHTPAADISTSLAGASIRPLNGGGEGSLVEGDGKLVSSCAANLVPGAANAGQATSDCAVNPEGTGCLDGVNGSAPSGSNNQCCPAALGTANRYLGRNAEELKHSGELPMDSSVSSDVCCANFVTAVLEQSGQIDWHSNGVADMEARLRAAGWREVPASQAKPGDIAIIAGTHTELVDSNEDGVLTLIGSNNVNDDGSQRVTKNAPYTSAFYYLTPPNAC